MHEVVNLNFWTQLILTLFFLSLGLLYLVKRTAARPDLMVPECAVCGKLSTKKCSRCKSVRYCSARCQTSDWNSGHKLKCKASLFGNGSKIALLPHTKPTLTPTQVLFPYHQFVQYFHWDRPTLPPCGLINCGNSCFANVVLQCLSWTRPLVAYLLETGHKRECRRNDWCFLCEFQTHLQRANQTRIPFSPINIISRLPNIGGNLGYGRQEDAHELMRFAIDMMQSVCLEEFGGEKVVPPRAQQTTLIQHVFGGLLQSQVQCTVCSTVSGQYENMMDLTVEIHGDAMSLEECLNQFTAKEWLQGDNMYKCDRCNDYVKACKRLSIHRAPNILTIALKRFQSGRFGKLNKRITFPETFELGPYMTTGGEASDVYKLYAVIVHLDMLNASFFGHYICYVKDFCGNWYRIDDSEVENVELEDVLSQRAYMLLYSRVQTRPSSLRCDEIKEEKKTDKLSTEPSQDGLVECSWVGTNDTSVSPLCDGIIAHSERSECKKELSSSSAVSLIVSEKDLQAEAANGKADTALDSESNPSIDMDHYSGTDGQEKAADGKEVPKIENMAVDSSCWDITTSSPFDATECKAPQKEDSDTTMIDAQ